MANDLILDRKAILALQFYIKNYDVLGSYILRPGEKKQNLAGNRIKECRFCGRASPHVSFRSKAHAIPEALGNKSLFSLYECDECNQLFGLGIENNFGIWSKPIRTLARIYGKKGAPTIRKGPAGEWRIGSGSEGLEIIADENGDFVSINEATGEVRIRLERDPYVPVAVLKTFVKIGLTLLPGTEMNNFRQALAWIRDPNHADSRWSYPVIQTVRTGNLPRAFVSALVLRRKLDKVGTPYAFLVLSYANEAYQIMIPSPEKDYELQFRGLDFPAFPQMVGDLRFNDTIVRSSHIDLCNNVMVKRELIEFTFVFDSVVATNIDVDN